MFVAHAAAYALIGALPRTGIAIFGIGAADPAVLERFSAQIDAPRTYFHALMRLVSWDFGRTIDGIGATNAVASAAVNSLPIVLMSTALIVVAALLALRRPDIFAATWVRHSFEFLTFLPAYLIGFLVLAATVVTGIVVVYEDTVVRQLVLAVCIGLTPACLAVSTVRNGFDLELRQQYVTYMRACGYDDAGVYRGVRRSILLHSVAGWDKLLTLQLAILIFTEAIFSYPGLGAFVVQAIQRTDINAILAIVTNIAIAVALMRIVAATVRAAIDPREHAETAAS